MKSSIEEIFGFSYYRRASINLESRTNCIPIPTNYLLSTKFNFFFFTTDYINSNINMNMNISKRDTSIIDQFILVLSQYFITTFLNHLTFFNF